MRRDRNRNLLALGFVAVLLGGGAAALSGTTDEKAQFTFNNATEVESFDPKVVTGVPEGRVLRCLLEGLANPHPETLRPVPGVAESWDVSDDGLVYTFHLRQDARWTDGEPVTSADFLYAWKRFLDPEEPATYAYILDVVKNAKAYYQDKTVTDFAEVGVRAPDEWTFVVELAASTPYFLDLTHFYPLYPVPRHVVEKYGDEWIRPEHFVGNGAFKLEERRFRDRVRLVKNVLYWDAANVRLESVDILPVDDHVTGLNLYLTGVVDWETDVPHHVIPELKKRADFKPKPYLGSYFYRVNLQNKDLLKRRLVGDPRFRKALYLAMDRQAIVESITKAGEVPARSLVPPGIDGYDGPMLPDRNLEEARRLVAEVKRDLHVDKLPTLTILYNTHETHRQIAEVIQVQWAKELGIPVKIENQEWGTYLTSQRQLDYDICRAAWIGDYADPNTFLDMFVTGGGNNNTGYASEDYDGLIRKAGKERDPAERMRILRRAEELLLTDLPVLPIYYYVTKNLVRPWVKGFHPNVQNIHPLKFVWIDEAEKRERSGER
ncbi:MAG: peptide ABC transporter substrate-binding protein [Planctomycetota bacterium]